MNRWTTTMTAGLLALTVWAGEPAGAQATADGSWTARMERDGERLRVRLTRWDETRGHGVHDAELDREGAEAIRAAAAGAGGVVEVDLRREAGVLRFEGRLRGGRGSGEFTFTEDPAWRRAMEGLGFRDIGADAALAAAIHQVGPARARALQEAGFRPDFDDLMAAAIFRVDPAFIQEMQALDLGPLAFSDLVAMRIHGLSADWLGGLREAGVALDDFDDALAFRIHGIDAAFVAEMKEVGLEELDADELLRIKIHGFDRMLRRRK